jgi:hypothetical protein
MIPYGYKIPPGSGGKNGWKQFSLLSPIFSERGKNHFEPGVNPPGKTAAGII